MGGRRILLYTHALAGGGAERVMALLASGLARRGHSVLFVTDYGSPENEGFLDPAVRRFQLGRHHGRATLRLAALLRSEKPDVSVSALGSNNLKLAVASILAGQSRRAIIAYHGFHVNEPRLLSQMSFWFAPLLTRVTGRTIAVSAALLADMKERWHVSRSRTRYIQNPVAWRPPLSMPTAEGLRAREPLVLACGRLTADKNFIGLIRAFAMISRPDARLAILGQGEERPALEAEIARLGLTGRVDLPGYVQQPWDYYERATCLASSSRTESFGLTIVEALAHGLPVVAADCGGPREIINSPAIGWLAKVGDDAELAAGLDAALSNPGDPAPRIARANDFSMESGVSAYEALIEELASERDAKRWFAPLRQARGARPASIH